jgi:peptide/nickel transport system ATP-binding protein
VSGRAVLSVRDLKVSARADAAELVRAVSFSVSAGQTLGLVGESGSGKTLSAMAVAGLLPHGLEARGDIVLDGVDLAAAAPAEARRLRTRGLGVVFQNPSTALNPRMTVGAQLVEALPRETRADGPASLAACLRLLDDVGIPRARERFVAYPHELSGGLAQRVVIALALARSPRLLIADEPTTALDVTVQAQILDLIDRLREEHWFGVLLITHDMGIIGDRADDVAVMSEGRIVETGPTARVLAKPATRQAALLADAIGRLDFTRQENSPPQQPSEPLLHINALRKRFAMGPAALDDVSVSVPRGTATGIVGESGSGKTTLARIVAGLERADEGSVAFQGRPRLPRTRLADIQYVFQDPYSSLDPRIRVLDTVSEPLLVQGADRANAADRARELLAEVGLDPGLWERRPTDLSGGQRQRVGIARAIATNPRLLIADEPVAALDSTVRNRVLDLLESLRRKRDMTLLLISHDLSVVAKLCSRVIVMRAGKIVEEGATRDVFQHPVHPYTRELVAAIPGRGRAFATELRRDAMAASA